MKIEESLKSRLEKAAEIYPGVPGLLPELYPDRSGYYVGELFTRKGENDIYMLCNVSSGLCLINIISLIPIRPGERSSVGNRWANVVNENVNSIPDNSLIWGVGGRNKWEIFKGRISCIVI